MSEKTTTIDIPLIRREASVAPVEGEDNVFEAVYSTGAPVQRYDWRRDEVYIQDLSMDKSAIRTERLDAGIVPILIDHYASVRNQVGIVEKHWIKDGKAYVRFRMETGTPDADGILNKLKQRIIRTVSVGAKVYKAVEKRDEETKITTRTATDWEPFEISLVAVPADAGAVIRSDETLHRCEIEVAGDVPAETTPATETIERSLTMPAPVTNPPEVIVDTARAAELETARAAAAAEARAAERERVSGISEIVRKMKLDVEFGEKLIADGTSLDVARTAVLEELAKRSDATASRTHVQGGQSFDDPSVIRSAVVNAFAHQMDPSIKLEGKANEYRGYSLKDGFEILERANGRTLPIGRDEWVNRALQGNSDFPVILADAAHRVVLADYQAAQPTFRQIARQRNFDDFKPHTVLRSGEFPALQKLSEHGEIKSASFADAQTEKVQLDTDAIMIGITRKLLINDSLGVISDMIGKLGRRIAAQENQAVWKILKDNPKMGDGKTLFHADHGNLHPTAVATPDLAAFSAGRLAMRKHTSDGIPLNFSAKYVIVPTDLETEVERLLTAILATKEGDVNIWSNKLQIICDPAIDDHNAWYMATSPADAEVITYGYLKGREGPVVETKPGWTVDGAEMRVIRDFGAGANGDKGIFKFKRS